MHDNNRRPLDLNTPAYLATAINKPQAPPFESEEESCAAFGFLRGLDARSLAVELRFRNGNAWWFSYSLLASWRHDPSVGLLLKFTSDVVSLVLIRGSNLDAPVGQAMVNLTDRGLQRHRVVFVREMDEHELRRAREGEPTIDGIEIAECETAEAQREWLKARAPAFLGGSV